MVKQNTRIATEYNSLASAIHGAEIQVTLWTCLAPHALAGWLASGRDETVVGSMVWLGEAERCLHTEHAFRLTTRLQTDLPYR